MIAALICSHRLPEAELGRTVLWRHNVARHFASGVDESLAKAASTHPNIVMVDRDLHDAERLVRRIREDPKTRGLSVVVFATGEFDGADVALLESGANAILRLPPGPEWDDRLFRLMNVPGRRDTRFDVHLRLELTLGESEPGFSATGLNLSTNGILIECGRPLQLGNDLIFAFRLPERQDLITGVGTVLRLAPGGRYGIEVHQIDGEGHRSIREFVEGKA